MKAIVKEIIIVLLLVLAILLVLGVFFYDYIPMNKVVPKIEQYEPPKNVKEELEENIEEKEEMGIQMGKMEIIITIQIIIVKIVIIMQIIIQKVIICQILESNKLGYILKNIYK